MISASLNAKILLDIINIADILHNEVLFDCKNDKIELRLFTSDRAVLLHIVLSSSLFTEYTSDAFKFFIDIKKIKSVLNIFGSTENIKIESIDDSFIKISSGKKYRKIRLFDLSLAPLLKEIPDIPCNFKAMVNSTEFASGIRLSHLEGDVFLLSYRNKLISINSLNDNTSAPLDDIKILTDSDDFKAHYSIDYIKEIIKLFPDYIIMETHSATTDIKVFPIVINFSLHDDNTKINFMLAPRVQVE